MRGLKPSLRDSNTLYRSRIFYRCVDWNKPASFKRDITAGRIFYRCVDWNIGAERISRYFNVASFTDAWIETIFSVISLSLIIVASFTDAWIETEICFITYSRFLCRIFYRCVDWNYIYCKKVCVYCFVASFTDAWIETISEGVTERPETVASFTDAWIETKEKHRQYQHLKVASFTDAWIET